MCLSSALAGKEENLRAQRVDSSSDLTLPTFSTAKRQRNEHDSFINVTCFPVVFAVRTVLYRAVLYRMEGGNVPLFVLCILCVDLLFRVLPVFFVKKTSTGR